jgi:hypothetical protein
MVVTTAPMVQVLLLLCAVLCRYCAVAVSWLCMVA